MKKKEVEVKSEVKSVPREWSSGDEQQTYEK